MRSLAALLLSLPLYMVLGFNELWWLVIPTMGLQFLAGMSDKALHRIF